MAAASANYERASLVALVRGDVDKLDELLIARPDLIHHRFKNRGNRTLLHIAAQEGSTSCLKKLLSIHGCKPLCNSVVSIDLSRKSKKKAYVCTACGRLTPSYV